MDDPYADYSSDESDFEQSDIGKQKWAWDEAELKKIQIDDITIQRSYRKVTCQLTINK